MEKVTIVPYPISTEYKDASVLKQFDHEVRLPPLGPLVVATLVRENCDADVEVLDINRAYLEHVDTGCPPSTFCEEFAKELAASNTGLFAFSSICSSYYVTLLIIDKLKHLRSDAITLLGGPQASATAIETMSRFPSVDFILVGEVEETLGPFLANYKSQPETVPGLVWRATDDTTRQNSAAPLPSIDRVPLPALDLWDMTDIVNLPLEAGRGCPFNCKFCSTSIHFGRRYRLKAADQLIAEFKHLKKLHALRGVSFVHDNMFCSLKQLEDFCAAWTEDTDTADTPWSCSLRSDFITDKVVNLLSKSGCSGVFIGVESGSPDIQQVIKKNLDIKDVRNAVRLLDDVAIPATLSFIVGFPEETAADFSKTLELYDWVLQQRHTNPQMGLLSPVAGSEYLAELGNAISFTQRYSNMAHQGDAISAEYERTLRAYPELFSAHYALPIQHSCIETLSTMIEFLKYTIAKFRWLLTLAALSVGGLERLLNEWLEFKGVASSLAEEVSYYGGSEFQRDFLSFCKTLPKSTDFPSNTKPQFDAMVCAYTIEEEDFDALQQTDGMVATSTPSGEFLAAMGVVHEMDYSYRDIMDAITQSSPIAAVPPKNSFVLIEKNAKVITIQEVSALTARIVELFTGGADKQAVVEKLMSVHQLLLPQGVMHKAAGFEFAIEKLASRGTLVRPVVGKAEAA